MGGGIEKMIKFVKFTIILCCAGTSSVADNIFISQYVFEWGEKNPKIVENYLRASLDTNAVSAYILGNLYLWGIFFQKDMQKADWFITKAANMKLPEAINSIGDGYYSGDIRPQNIKMALKYYKKAANMGFGVSQFNAGIVLLNTAKSIKALYLARFYLDKASKNRDNLKEVVDVAKRYKRDIDKKLKQYR